MDLRGHNVLLHDMSLRDGMHAKQHQISIEEMIAVSQALDAAGMPLIEVTHGDGLGGASVNYGFSRHPDEEFLVQAALAPIYPVVPPYTAYGLLSNYVLR